MKENKQVIMDAIKSITIHCLGGIVLAILLQLGVARLFGGGHSSRLALVYAGLIGCSFGYVLGRVKMISKNITICAAIDPLTQLNNRLRFNEILDREILRSNRHNTPLSVILAGIDTFSKIGKTYGRRAGEDVLMRVATIVKAVSRDVDICARWESDEFILLLPDTDIEGATISAERLREKVANEFIPVVGQVTVSLGVTQFKGQGELKENFIDRADNALYRVRQTGRNGVEVA